MRMTGIGMIAAAAMLAGGMGLAVAQTSTTSPSAAPSSGKCWDSVTKQVRNETPSTSTGSSTSSSMSGTSTNSTATGSPSTSSSTKPPEAAGLPDCKH